VPQAKAKGNNSSRKTTQAQSDDDDIIDLEKRSTPRQGGDEDYAKTTDECLHVELTKQLVYVFINLFYFHNMVIYFW
jgi:hypothetical protein